METKLNVFENTTRKNVWRLAGWTGGWAITMAISAFGPKFLWDYDRAISIVAILINTIIGVGMILMNRKYANGLDEMHRKIFMEAKALALGVGVVGGPAPARTASGLAVGEPADVPTLECECSSNALCSCNSLRNCSI